MTSASLTDGRGSYDVIIVGAGSAGCILANRLSRDPKRRVLLVEAGREEKSVFIRMPASFPYASTSAKFDWGYVSEPEAALKGRSVSCPRGRLFGGSSSINGMAFVRGDPADFDDWAEKVGDEWSYENCLPYFKSLETFSGGANAWRGGSGPLSVIAPRYSAPLNGIFLDACRQAGYKVVDDTNGRDNDGFGPMDQTIRGGVRETSATAFLTPVVSRANLTLLSGALVTRVILDKCRATGIEIIENGVKRTIPAGEIILSAGAINSPQLLMLSGIGDADPLKSVGVKPVVDLPGVGRSLQDHVDVSVMMRCSDSTSQSHLLRPHRKLMLGMQWMLTHKGPGSTNHFEVAGYIRTSPEIPRPDIQLCFIPLLTTVDGSGIGKGHGYQCTVMLLRPRSRGTIALRTAEPTAAPILTFNYLADPADGVDLREGVRRLREILMQPALARVSAGELSPGPDVMSDEAIDGFIRETVKSTHHPCGTCRMGLANDNFSVVDPEGRVHTASGLRVVDASIFPSITSGNVNAPTMMVAEKLAARIAH